MSDTRTLILFVASCALLSSVTEAAPARSTKLAEDPTLAKGHLVKFHPISRAQYESILQLSGGETVISEARLVDSGLHPFGDLRSIGSAIDMGVQYVLNITGLNLQTEKSSAAKVEGYPLCVIKISDLDGETDHPHERTASEWFAELDAQHGAQHDNHNGNEEERPSVSCVVVVKKPENDTKDDVRPHPKRRYHPQAYYPPPPPPPYYYNYWYDQKQNGEERGATRELSKGASDSEEAGRESAEASDDYYRQVLHALNTFYLQQSHPNLRQLPYPTAYPSYPLGPANSYSPYGAQGAYPFFHSYPQLQGRPSSHRKKHQRYDSSEELEGDYSGEYED